MRRSSSCMASIVRAGGTVRSVLMDLSGRPGAGDFFHRFQQSSSKEFRMTAASDNNTTRIALITGASRGLGRNSALKLAEQGIDLIITYKSNEAEAQEVVRSAQALGRRALALQLDVADSGGFAAFAGRVKKALAGTWQREQFDY